MLSKAGYPANKIHFIHSGFTKGFDIQYHGPVDRQSTSDNIPLTVGTKTDLWNKLMKEVGLKRVAGPFEKIPYENFIQSPVGLVPKVGSDQTRLIFHLSYDFKNKGLRSVNHYTPKELCSVRYRDLDYAVHTFLKLCQDILTEKQQAGCACANQPAGRYWLQNKWREQFINHKHCRHCRSYSESTILAGKSDIKSAFRILGLSPESWRWLIMKAQDPETGFWFYFIDKCLPFGSSLSCAIFQKFSDALCFLTESILKVHRCLTNYLDDFLFIACTVLRCNFMIQKFLDLCSQLGIPISMEKTEWGTEIIVFLGILLDGRNLVLGVPLEKRERALELLTKIINQKKATVKDLQKLCGYLNFLGKAIFPGRTFTRRMYAKFSSVINQSVMPQDSYEYKLKQHHHIRLDQEFKLDCKVWIEFLKGDLQTAVTRPMVDILDKAATSKQLKFFSDASASKKLGFGALLDNRWIRGDWGCEFIEKYEPSIEFLELFTLCAGIFTWQDHESLVNNRVIIFCDNMAVVHMINDMSSKCPRCMSLIRLLALNNLKFNRRITANFVSTKDNFLSDALSHNQMLRFRKLGPEMNLLPDEISKLVWPIANICN